MKRDTMTNQRRRTVMPHLELLEHRCVPALLFQNGNWVTGIANGFGGANTSEIENTFISYGFTSSTPTFHVADDFTVPGDVFGWNLAKFRVYSYQTDAPPGQNTFSKLHLKLYSGVPGAGGVVTLDCSGANAIDVTVSTAFTNAYRVDTGDLQNNDRAVKAVSGSLCASKRVVPGTYWVEWSLEGDNAYSAPRSVVTVPWDASDNARQLNVSSGIWSAAIDPPGSGGNGKVQDLYFEIEGRVIPLGIPPAPNRPAPNFALPQSAAANAKQPPYMNNEEVADGMHPIRVAGHRLTSASADADDLIDWCFADSLDSPM